jgi:hypothetical protein
MKGQTPFLAAVTAVPGGSTLALIRGNDLGNAAGPRPH